VADGASTDGTVEILQDPASGITRWLSAPDGGISDGFNRAIALARAPWVKLVNADDWPAPGALDAGMAVLDTDPGLDLVYGPVQMVDHAGRPTRRVPGVDLAPDAWLHSLVPAPHPSWIVARSTYARIGLYSPDLRYTMDYEWFLRLRLLGGRVLRVDGLEVLMREGGASTRGRLVRDRENYAVTLAYGSAPALAARGVLVAKTGLDRLESVLERLLPGRLAGLPRAAIRRLVGHG